MEAACQLQKFVPHVPVTNPHSHIKHLCPSKIQLLPLSLISVTWLSISPHPHCFWKHTSFSKKTLVQYIFFPLKMKTFILRYPLPPPNEKSIIIYTSVQALLYVRNLYCIIQKHQISNKLLNKLGWPKNPPSPKTTENWKCYTALSHLHACILSHLYLFTLSPF